VSWVDEAASLPVAFAQVREDPRLDLAMVQPGARVMMVASGGETALCLAREPLARLVAVDVNPAQLALVRCKEWLARHASRQAALEWLGHAPLDPEDRAHRIKGTLAALGLSADALGPLSRVAERGPDSTGRYEQLFRALRRVLDAAQVRAALAGQTPLPTLAEAFDTVMSLDNLVRLFGPGATQNPRQPFARHFLTQTCAALRARDAAENPFLWQVLTGGFPVGTTWDWLQTWTAPQVPIEYVCAPMLEALEAAEPASLDLVHLSNILDWLTPEEATRTLQAARQALRSGGRVSVRQLNSSLAIPELPVGLEWEQVTERDRSYFYLALYVGRKP